MRLLKILFAIFILLFPLAEVGRIQFGNGVAVSFNDVLLGIVVLVWLTVHVVSRKKIEYGMLAKPVALFAGIGFVSLLLNFPNLGLSSWLIAFLYLVRWLAYAAIYLIVTGFDKKYKEVLSYLLLISGSLVAAAGYIQYFFYPSLRNLFYLGWDEHLYRMFSTFLDPNFLGVFLVIFFLFSLALGLKAFKKERVKSMIILSISFLTLIATYLTYSRSALLMLLLSVITYLFILSKKKLIAVVVVGIILVVFILPKSFQTEGTNFLRAFSSEQRVESLGQGLSIFQTSPLYGIGFDAYRYALNKRGLDNSIWQVTHSGAGTDNSFVFILATTGIIGLMVFIWLLYKIVKMANANPKNPFSVVLISTVIGLLFGSLFVNSFFYVLILEWVWVLAGLTEKN
jgi:O-antigen ligase